MADNWDQFKPVAAPSDEWEQFKKTDSAPAAAQKSDGESWKDFIARTDKELEGGIKHGLTRTARGLADTVSEAMGPRALPFQLLNRYAASKGLPLTPTNEMMEEGKKFVEGSGPMADVGQFGAEAVAQGLFSPSGKTEAASKAVGFLPKALQALKNTVGEAAVNAGVSGAMTPEEEKLRAATGAAAGTVLGKAVGAAAAKGIDLGKSGGQWVLRELRPNAGADARAMKVFERTLGNDELERAITQIENAPPSMLPRTTAAMSGSEGMGSMEKYARNSNFTRNVDPEYNLQPDVASGKIPAKYGSFGETDNAVRAAAHKVIQEGTSAADDLANLQGQHTKIFNEGQAILDKLPFSQANRKAVAQDLLKIRNSNGVIGDTTGSAAKQIDAMIRASDNPNATLGALAQLYTTADGSVPGIARAKGVLKDVLDKRSGGEFTNILEGYGATADAIKKAEAAAAFRGKFVPEGPITTAVTPKYTGESGANAVPNVESFPLRKAIVAHGEGLSDSGLERAHMLADQLRGHEIYKSPGSGAPDIGTAEAITTGALNAGPLWRFRGTIQALFGPINEKTSASINEALLDPQKFLSLVEQRRASNARIPEWEAKLEKIIRNSGQLGARVGTASASGE